MGLMIKKGFDYGFDPMACSTCPGNCCSGDSGNVWVDQEEIINISRYLKTNQIDFINNYLYKVNNRLSIKERHTEQGFQCIFLAGSRETGCSIYPVRPVQCRLFPFWDHFKKHKDQLLRECPGIVSKP